MKLRSRDEHAKDFKATYVGKPMNAGKDQERDIELCYRVYRNSYTNGLGSMLMGRIERKGIQGIGDLERENFGTTNITQSGAVLNSDYWSIPANDSWLLGGIHAGHPFDVASALNLQNLEDKARGVTVTGRELIGLDAFGYSYFNASPAHSHGYFECRRTGLAAGATFAAYQRAYDSSLGSGAWRNLVQA